MFVKNAVFAERYVLIEKVGSGAFAEVWKASYKLTNSFVALKIYAPDKGLPDEGIKQFSEEYVRLLNLNHSNLLKASFFDIYISSPYLVLPFCPKNASSLAGQMDEKELAEFIFNVSAGLAYLHERNIIHQDIKPSNILITEEGDYVISDFGISTRLKKTLSTGSMEGAAASKQYDTPAYAAPERFSHNKKDREPIKANDIFSLGITIYEMVDGSLPFEVGYTGLNIRNGSPIPDLPEQFYSGENEGETKIPLLLNLLFKDCISKDPWERPSALKLREIAEGYIRTGKWNYDGDIEKHYQIYITRAEANLKEFKNRKPSDGNSTRENEIRSIHDDFKKALEIKPKDKYCLQKIEECRNLLKPPIPSEETLKQNLNKCIEEGLIKEFIETHGGRFRKSEIGVFFNIINKRFGPVSFKHFKQEIQKEKRKYFISHPEPKPEWKKYLPLYILFLVIVSISLWIILPSERKAFDTAKKENSIESFKNYVKVYPDGKYLQITYDSLTKKLGREVDQVYLNYIEEGKLYQDKGEPYYVQALGLYQKAKEIPNTAEWKEIEKYWAYAIFDSNKVDSLIKSLNETISFLIAKYQIDIDLLEKDFPCGPAMIDCCKKILALRNDQEIQTKLFNCTGLMSLPPK